jgi:hypothetical protein
MEANGTQQEILLITGTTFTSSLLSDNNDPPSGKELTEKERLEEACWNGWLRLMLPEICIQGPDGKCLSLWQIREATSFLELDFCDAPATIDRQFSITPHSFLSMQSYC